MKRTFEKTDFSAVRFMAAVMLYEKEGKNAIHFLYKWQSAAENVEDYLAGARNPYFVEEGLDGLLAKKKDFARMAINSIFKLNKAFHRGTSDSRGHGLYFMKKIEDIENLTEVYNILEAILDAFSKPIASEE